ncbi:hypothetical protein HJG43_13585 [Kineosporiaceae bacterium SCSIO 59966]|nr:hypothetical protein HJG43_13585 [Kineosporiaceae bacterium SCSIO 59966]
MPAARRRPTPSGRPDGLDRSRAHVLVLPGGIDVEDVEPLVRQREPAVAADPGGGLRIGRHTRLLGPFAADDVLPAGAHPDWALAWVLDCPAERGDPPLPGITDPDGLYRAFPHGLPVRAEGRAVGLLVALARRLRGAVRVAGSGLLLRPDPDVAVDVVVHAAHRLDRDTLRAALVAAGVPATEPDPGAPWAGPPPDLVEHPPDEAVAALPTEERAALHARADRLDAEVLAAEQAVRIGGERAAGTADAAPYALVVDMARSVDDAESGIVEVLVHPAEDLPPAVAGHPWAGRATTYEVRWAPEDPAVAALEAPGGALVAARRRAAAVVRSAARVVTEAAEGIPVDADGFLLDRYSL